ncbi:E3 ubiquitin-protein ligase RNF133 [Rhynchocyon petersi]
MGKVGTEGSHAVSSWLIKLCVLWLLSGKCCKAGAVWTAYMNISFLAGNRILSELGEIGVFGRSSALKRVAGIVVPPDGKIQNACSLNTNFSGSKDAETWLALIERGRCTFTRKIKVAARKGASGVVIYNFPGTGNQVFPMSHQALDGTVAVMIGNLKGTEILHLIQKGFHVTAMVDVGRKHILWMNHYFVSFVIVTTATFTYFIFYHIRRLWLARVESQRWQKLTRDVTKAFGQLHLQVLKEGDKEIHGDSCVVCFDPYQPTDTIRVLTCKHFFHKNCIDPWILAHGTCPICKRDILKALGIHVDVEEGAESLQVLMMNALPGSLAPTDQRTNNELPPERSGKESHVVEQPSSQSDSEGHPSL